MDAASIRKLNLALPMLLVSAAFALPWTAQAQSFSLSSNSVQIVGGQQAPTVTVSSTGSPITFNVSSNQSWVLVSGQGASGPPFTTPVTLVFENISSNGSPPPATVTLTSTIPSGLSTTITVSYVNNSGTGGGGGGTGGGSGTGNDQLSANSTNVSNVTGGSSTQQVQLTNTSGPDTVNFNVSVAYGASGIGWLQVSPASSSVAPGATQTLTLTFIPNGLTIGNYTATVTVSNQTVTQTITIQVTYQVTISSTITLTPSSANLSPSNPSVNVSVGAPTTYFSATSNANWILLAFLVGGSPSAGQSQLYNINTSNPLVVELAGSSTYPATGTTGTVTISDQNGNTSNFTVTFTGSGSGTGSGTITLTPSPVALNLSNNYQATVTIQSSSATGNVQIGLTGFPSNAVSFQYVNASSIGTAPGSVQITLTGNVSSLSSGQTYSGTLTATVGSSQGTATVNLTVGSSSSGGAGGTGTNNPVEPLSLSFVADINHPAAIVPQNIFVTSVGSYSATAAESSCTGTQWLNLASPSSGTANGAGSPTTVVQVQVDPTGVPIGTCSGTVSVQTTSQSSAYTVSVTLTVYSGTVIYAQTTLGGGAGSAVFLENNGNLNSAPVTYYIPATDTSSISLTATTDVNWISFLGGSGGSLTGSTLTNIQTTGFGFLPNSTAANMQNGVYVGHITFTGNVQNSPLIVPVVLIVTNNSSSSGISLSPSSVILNAFFGGTSVSGLVSVTSTSSVGFTASASTNSGGSWLSVTSSGTAPTNITVTANPAGLAANTYTGTITVTSSIGTAQASVTFVVGTGSGTGNNIACSPSPCGSLTFTYNLNASTPNSQSVSIVSASGSASTSFSVSSSVNGSGIPNWLSVSTGTGGTTGTTPGTVIVNVNPSGLSAAPYTGLVTVSSSANSVQIPVTFNVQAPPTVMASPSSLSFQYQVGGTTPSPGQLNVSGSTSGLTYGASALTSSGGNWLSINKTTGTTPDVLSVTVNPASLAAGTTYTGTITVNGTGSASGSTTVQVSLTITAPFPTITQVQNAASFANGPISPGEIVTLFGSAMGPSTPLGTTLTSAGKVSTQLGQVQVLFNGTPAPLLYVSASQINCVVPYELAGFTSPFVEVKYLGQTSNTVNLQAVATAPGIFATGTPAGTGQGAILNFDNSPNGNGANSRPAAPGSVVQIYMTGEGALSPAQATGSVTCSAGCSTVSQIPVPLLVSKMAVLVNNQPATIQFAGEAPGFVSGVLQVNVTIPPNTPAGNVPLSISIGGVSSQSNVTVAVGAN